MTDNNNNNNTNKMPIQPIVVCPLCYVLECEHGMWYVGITLNLNQRLAQHQVGIGARWTRLHRPLCVYKVISPAAEETERQETLRLMLSKGWQNVRGGPWCRPDMNAPPAALLELQQQQGPPGDAD